MNRICSARHRLPVRTLPGVGGLLFDGEALTIESLNAVGRLEQPAFAHLVTHRGAAGAG